jgi:phosphoserine aminotransferase
MTSLAATYRAYNFYGGPTSLPNSVLERIQTELFNFQQTGMSVMEINHRTPEIEFLIGDTVARIKRLLGLDEQFEVILLQGGGALQFAMMPMNFSAEGDKVDYVDTGYWSFKAIAEAQRLRRDVGIVASSADKNYRYVPRAHEVMTRPGAKYLHLCTNETVSGTQWHQLPQPPIPLLVDMSSDFMTRPMNPQACDLIYAHAQKNVGIAGVTVVVLKKKLLERITAELPHILDYRVHVEHHSNYHTPPTFAIYVTWLMMCWLEEEIGGLAEMAKINQLKAELLYNFLDESTFYQNQVESASRSWLNVVFNLPTPALEAEFIQTAAAAGFKGLAGHRVQGGCRASLFNSVTVEAVHNLLQFMHQFSQEHQ